MSIDGPPMPWENQPWLARPSAGYWDTRPPTISLGGFRVGFPPIGVVTTRIPVPAVVPRPTITIVDTKPPPLVGAGLPELPTSGVLPPGQNGEETVALEDGWAGVFQTGLDIWRGNQQVSQPSYFAGGGVGATPTSTLTATQATSALPTGMYYDKHGHLVHRRKRRRPCITQTDLSLAWQVSNLPNNANVRMFLAKCVH